MGDSAKAYLNTVARIEPDIAPLDPNGALASIAISTKRIADSLEYITNLIRKWEPIMDVTLAEAHADLAENQRHRK